MLGDDRADAALDSTDGETGTGKEMLACARSTAPRAPTGRCCRSADGGAARDSRASCSGSEGRFHWRDANFAGVIRVAAGGTLFLDESRREWPARACSPSCCAFSKTHEVHGLGETTAD